MSNKCESDEAVQRCATAISKLFSEVFYMLETWRTSVEKAGAGKSNAEIDSLVHSLVTPELSADNPFVIGAGFIAAPTAEPGRTFHFAWWLGPLQENPLLGTTTTLSRLDLASREYTEYLKDFRAFEWYQIPAATQSAHITGPYVDHLCTCDYILTITLPVRGRSSVQGVVGVDILVRRLEQEVMPLLRTAETAVALISSNGRVIVSVSPSLRVGSLVSDSSVAANGWETLACPGTELRLLVKNSMI